MEAEQMFMEALYISLIYGRSWASRKLLITNEFYT